ncbi:hypothetical protein VN12_08255 [Pirellula sp. SH-Sr6A]|uniref:hypothetical protein n=1 Tax=Pirellula sp. SH-Sr6A TaxID=1632865 RepID=UPI00078D4E9E|nr:hypothetical protein [Pirellula sp. SH-Sr6A]AMV32100.1 hypothetical protein VN12_08255 [Pirellula sp. SH-Sr6A]
METVLSTEEVILITVDSPLQYPETAWESLANRLRARTGSHVLWVNPEWNPSQSQRIWDEVWEACGQRNCKRLVWIPIGREANGWEMVRDGVVWERMDARQHSDRIPLQLYVAAPMDARDWCEFLISSVTTPPNASWLFWTEPPGPIDPIGEDQPREENQRARQRRTEVVELVWEFRRRGLDADFAFRSANGSVHPVAKSTPRVELIWNSPADIARVETQGPESKDTESQWIQRERDVTYRIPLEQSLPLEGIDSILLGKWLGALQFGKCAWTEDGLDRNRDRERLEHRIRESLPPEYARSSEPVSPRSMGSATLPSEEFGEVPWGEIWTSFCDLALAGGPPHRGTLLEAVDRSEIESDPDRYQGVVRELCRGIPLASGLPAFESTAKGWVGVVCDDESMASWLLRAIVAENVTVRREGRNLFVPAGPRFTVKKEIKNVITSLAKTVRYWRSR